jgi:elongation factor Ts
MEKIKLLREKTGAGMVDCKKALEESGGDIDKAIEYLRKKGIAKAAKRGEREVSEGVVRVKLSADGNEAYILEVNAETDFVAKNERFQNYADELMALIETKKPADMAELMSLPMSVGTALETLGTLSGTIGEKLVVKGFAILSAGEGSVAAYSHAGGRIGVLVQFDQKVESELARNIAMHIAASAPKYINPEEVPAAELDKEKEIYAEQLRKEGKPEEMIEKIMGGKVAKYYEEVCLVKQEYIMEDKKKVEAVLGSAKVTKFVRFSL